MKLPIRSLEDILSQLQPLPSDWLDEVGQETLKAIDSFIEKIGDNEVTIGILEELLTENVIYLDVIRLFLGMSQDEFAQRIASLSTLRGSYSSIRGKAKKEELRTEILQALDQLDAVVTVDNELNKQWTVNDVLYDRYKFQRGRAIKGQRRGRGLEDAVQEILEKIKNENGMTYDRGVTFTSRDDKTAKSDFAIPSGAEPKIIIECKGFEATGSKLTDVLGDISKIVEAKTAHTYFFIVTDGTGWFNRTSDLKKIVEHHKKAKVDMIYTMATFNELEETIRYIVQHEM